MLTRLKSLKDRQYERLEKEAALAEPIEVEVKPKVKALRGLKVGKNKKNKNKNDD